MGFNLLHGKALLERQLPGRLQLIAIEAFGDSKEALRTLTERFGDDLVIHGSDAIEERGGILSLAYRDVHPHDLSQVLDQHGVCVRAGHHCAKPLMKALGVNATARASLYLYNDETDVDALADALGDAGDFFAF